MIYFNSVAIGGSAGGSAQLTAAFNAVGLDFDLKNNILQNQRTSMNRNYAVVTKLSAGFTSDYNDLFAAKSSECGSYNGGLTARTFAQWKTGTGRDANSLNLAAVFTGPITCDLHTNTLALKAGTPVSSVAYDFDNDLRNLSAPTIGADEITSDNLKADLADDSRGDSKSPLQLPFINIYSEGKVVNVLLDLNAHNYQPTKGTVQIFDLMGQLILNYTGELQTVNRFTLNVRYGYYVVRVQSNGQVETKKVIIN